MSERAEDAQIVELHAIFRGRVQGVGFRFTAQIYAERMGLCGTVRNVPDGTVEIYVQGSRQELDEFLRKLVGPSGPGHIDGVTKEYKLVSTVFTDFRVIF